MIQFGFEKAGFEHLIAFAVPENKASLRVMQKIGMRFQKEMRFRGKDFIFYEIDRAADPASY
jgi:RimJ/RimL family protein N-acetyltransferase